MKSAKDLKRWLVAAFHSLFYGMKTADDIMTTSSKDSSDSVSVTQQKENGGGVYRDMLEEKMTQEVEELRYSSYAVPEESRKYLYKGNGMAVKKNKELAARHVKVREDEYDISIIQDNYVIEEGVLELLEEADVDKKLKKNTEYRYNVKIKRECLSKYNLPEMVKKVVVMRTGTDTSLIDLYCSVYPRQFMRQDRPFIREVRAIMEGDRHIDFLEFDEISFSSYRAFGSKDYMKYEFDKCRFMNVGEFDGNFVIRYSCHNKDGAFGRSEIELAYSKSGQKKYDEKAPREGNKRTMVLTPEMMEPSEKAPSEEIMDKVNRLKLGI